jgi:hypothetical protein
MALSNIKFSPKKIEISLLFARVTFQRNSKSANNKTTTLGMNLSKTLLFLRFCGFPLFSYPRVQVALAICSFSIHGFDYLWT